MRSGRADLVLSETVSGLTGGTVAKWSKAKQLMEKINENHKDPRIAPAWATFKIKKTVSRLHLHVNA